MGTSFFFSADANQCQQQRSNQLFNPLPFVGGAAAAAEPGTKPGGCLSGHMQKLTISSNEPAKPIEPDPSRHLYSHPSFTLQQPRSPRNMHTRSFSDNTHPYPQVYPTAAATAVATANGSRQYLHPGYQHRRAISANALNAIIHNHTPHQHQQSPPPLMYSSASTSTNGSSSFHHHSVTQSNEHQQSAATAVAEGNDRYACTYCGKKFSRPSSLRIHTYSHTGEKPFECPEEGCSRKFSVQSNMRRHLRVHRLGRATKRNNYSKVLIAKPSTWNK